MKNQKTAENKKEFQTLMRKIQEKPNEGLEAFYKAYGRLIQTTARCVCRSLAQADEVVNLVLVKTWRFSHEKIEIDNPEGWIYILTVNTAKDAMREKTFLPLREEMANEKDEEEELLSADAFYAMIAILSEEEQAIMIEKFIQKRTFREIAEGKRKKLGTLTSIYYRALEKIKKSLEERHGN